MTYFAYFTGIRRSLFFVLLERNNNNFFMLEIRSFIINKKYLKYVDLVE